jgi:uncharacterized coiled-coil protein SlyX
MRTWKTISALAALALLCASAAHAQPRQNGFSVVLLIGETQATTVGDTLPPAPAVRKALADLKDFLPYKSYRVLDTQWLRTGSTRMRGLDDQEYDVDVGDLDTVQPQPMPAKAGTVRVFFKLHGAGPAMGAAMSEEQDLKLTSQLARLATQLVALETELAALGQRYAEQDPSVVRLKTQIEQRRMQIDQTKRQLRPARSLVQIDSRFDMQIGETVVVGTSKMGGGDKGLVVLLTAVAAAGK